MISAASLTGLGWRILNGAHRAVTHATRGRLLGRALGLQFAELHTVGRKSGLPRSTMLLVPVVDGERVVLVASKGGAAADPDWYRNLLAQPEAELTMNGRRWPVRARTASAAEKAQLWPRIIAKWRFYDGYQRRSGRDLPVVICDPR
jgi:deazaflavin-dependent oxidoreductase (nitroreductase family)